MVDALKSHIFNWTFLKLSFLYWNSNFNGFRSQEIPLYSFVMPDCTFNDQNMLRAKRYIIVILRYMPRRYEYVLEW